MSPSCDIVGRDIVECSVSILRCCRLRISRWILPRWNWLATRAHRHWVESNDVERVIERFEPFVRSHSRGGDLILLDAFDFGGGRQNQIDFQPFELQNGFQGGIIC